MITSSRPCRLAAVTSHPVQYQAPLFEALAKHDDIDLTVFYGHWGGTRAALDPEFGIPIQWDRPLMSGYRSVVLADSPARGLAARLAILRHLYKGRFDAVFIHSYATGLSLFAYLGAWLTGTPILLRTESHRLRPRRRIVEVVKSLMLRPLFKFTDAFLYIGVLNREFFQHYDAPATKLFHTPYCVDNDFFIAEVDKARADREQLRAELGFGRRQFVVVYSGKLIARKRVDVLIRAAGVCRERGCDMALLLIGDGALRDEMTTLADQLGVQARFVGFQNQSQLPRHYACGDAFVLPSADEPWGLVLNEAMAAGLPVSATDQTGAARDLIVQGETGEVFPSGSFVALADILERWVRNPDTIAAVLGRNARRRVEQFSYSACVQGIHAALDHVVVTR